ncbi:DUF1343 domain-containing protein [Fulvivirgaceae bacterium PWU20]|uniref:DUF1343 domain-containing protein n=2 Tax=Chryseosolibacter indicus TaxID=2782351 RepID=A0ABS5VUY4_9BACT|nr:DUF1343 domain-containing protein [Chryseosolibacter indicus]
MAKYKIIIVALVILPLLSLCSKKATSSVPEPATETPNAEKFIQPKLVLGAEQIDLLITKVASKSVALVVNNTSLIGKTHLADTLKSRGVNIRKIFAPEHGFRGTADAGEHVKDGVDIKTGLSLVSLYGSNRKPTPEQLADVDVIIFDIQDVGVRFYTYISTLHLVMEACSALNKKVIVLDRPNPNGSYVDGPVLEPSFKSFLGMHTIPLVHGLTIGELAQMINGEGWLPEGRKCELEVITMKNWKHTDFYSLPEKPSPNLPNDQAIRLYPSLGLFEGTNLSVGRGTQMPFQVVGHPDLKGIMPFEFTPVSIVGMAKNPPYENKACYGLDLRTIQMPPSLTLKYLLEMYNAFPDKNKFFNDRNFDTHLGTSKLREQIKAGLTEEAIRQTWQKDLDTYKQMRAKYLLYP